MKKIVFALNGNEMLARRISDELNIENGAAEFHQFPDGETYVRVPGEISGKTAIIVCTLNQPDTKLLPLYFLSKTLKEMGAAKVILVAPYLAYMRQDKRFRPGEAITSRYFAELISLFTDELITIDPHLHRTVSLSGIYSVPCTVLHATGPISEFIKSNIKDPLLIGPDIESEQWVSEIARSINSPFIVLQKERYGDKEVKVKVPKLEEYKHRTPVLIDDIISTARTMIEAARQLKESGMKLPVCIGVHAVFAAGSFKELRGIGIEKVVTCNTIVHESNYIDISDLILSALKNSRAAG